MSPKFRYVVVLDTAKYEDDSAMVCSGSIQSRHSTKRGVLRLEKPSNTPSDPEPT